MNQLRRASRLGLFVLLTVLGAGCAIPLPPSPRQLLARWHQGPSDPALAAAQAAWYQGDTPAAIARLEAMLARNPKHLEARILLGEVLLSEARTPEAMGVLEPALAAPAGNARAHYLMAVAQDASGQREEALAHYQRASHLEPKNDLYLASLQHAAAKDRERAPGQGATPPAAQLAGAGDDHPVAAHVGGSTAAPDHPAASADVQADPSLPAFLQDSSKTRRNVVATARTPRNTTANQGGLAAPAAERAVPISGEGAVQSAARPAVPATDLSADASIQFAPGVLDPDAAAGTPCVLIAEADATTGAVPANYSAPAVDREDAAGQGSNRTVRAGAQAVETPAAASTQAIAGAAGAGQQAAEPAAEDLRAVVAAAVEALKRNRPDEAIALIEPVLPEHPQSAALHRTLGMARFRQTDYAGALTALEKSVELDKTHALSYFLMGCTLQKLGQPEAAETRFRQAQAIDPRYASP